MKKKALLLHLALVLGALVTVTPLFWMASASFMSTGESTTFPPSWIPKEPTLEQYRTLFTRLDLGRAFANSLGVSLAATFVSLAFNAMAGYAFAKLRFPGRDRLFRTLLAALAIPAQVGMLPLFLLLRSFGWINTWWGVLAPSLATIFGLFLIRQFVLSIPDELLDAARIDGASEGRIFFSLVLPLTRPILVTLALFTFLATWNDFLWPLVILTDGSRHTLPVALANLVGEHVQDTELMMAGSMLTVLPVLILFLALQRHYVEGILLGSVKG